jgi:fructose-specific phosphotransferase system IIA component
MRITDFLTKENVVVPLAGSGKEAVIRELCARLAATGAIDAVEPLFEAAMSRERLGSTGIGDGVAIPHAKTRGVKKLTAAVGVAHGGVDFDAVDDQPVRLVFLLLAGEEATAAHLKALARISRLLKNTGFRDKAARAVDADGLFDLVRTEDEGLG